MHFSAREKPVFYMFHVVCILSWREVFFGYVASAEPPIDISKFQFFKVNTQVHTFQNVLMRKASFLHGGEPSSCLQPFTSCTAACRT